MKITALTTLALTLTTTLALSQDNSRIVDGDTFTHNGQSYRIAGIDAPELDQPCPEALEAKRALRLLLTDPERQCSATGESSYGRPVVTCPEVAMELIDQELVFSSIAPGPSCIDPYLYRQGVR